MQWKTAATADDDLAYDSSLSLFGYQRLLEALRKWRGPYRERYQVRIGEVGFFYAGVMSSWYFTSGEDGSLRRKNRVNLGTSDFVAALARGRTPQAAEPVALAVL